MFDKKFPHFQELEFAPNASKRTEIEGKLSISSQQTSNRVNIPRFIKIEEKLNICYFTYIPLPIILAKF